MRVFLEASLAIFVFLVRPLLGPAGACRFHPSCAEHARRAIERLPPWRAVRAIAARLLRCHPWNLGGAEAGF